MTTNATDKRSVAARLASARLQVEPIAHDKMNAHHKYPYTSAEAIIGHASRVLATEGLTTLPIATVYEPFGNGVKLAQTWLLLADGCDPMTIQRDLYCEQGQGRPLDKQLCGASTVNLAYFFRDLLGIQRPDSDDDFSGRDDTKYVPSSKPRLSAPPKVGTPVEKSAFAASGGEAATLESPTPLTGEAFTAMLRGAIKARCSEADPDKALQAAAAEFAQSVGIPNVSTASTEHRAKFLDRITQGTLDIEIKSAIPTPTALNKVIEKITSPVPVDEMRTTYTMTDLRRIWREKSGSPEHVARIALDLHATEMFSKIAKNLNPDERKQIATGIYDGSVQMDLYNQTATDQIAAVK